MRIFNFIRLPLPNNTYFLFIFLFSVFFCRSRRKKKVYIPILLKIHSSCRSALHPRGLIVGAGCFLPDGKTYKTEGGICENRSFVFEKPQNINIHQNQGVDPLRSRKRKRDREKRGNFSWIFFSKK